MPRSANIAWHCEIVQVPRYRWGLVAQQDVVDNGHVGTVN